MKPLHLFTTTQYKWTYAELNTLDMKTTMSNYFLSQWLNVVMYCSEMWKRTLITPHLMLCMLRAIIHEVDIELDVRCSTLHFTAVMFAAYWFSKLEWDAIQITLKRSTSTLLVILNFEWPLLHIITVSLIRIHPIFFVNQNGATIHITSVQIAEKTFNFID